MREGHLVIDNVLFDANLSPAGFRSRLALRIADIQYMRVSVDLALFDQKSDHYRLLNPTGQVPTLMLGGECVFDSHAIVDRVLQGSSSGVFRSDESCRFNPAALQNVERAISQVMRPAVYEIVGPQRLRSRFDNWNEAHQVMEGRGVSPYFLEFAQSLFHKKSDPNVVRSVIRELEPLLGALEPLIEKSVPVNGINTIDYFDICLGPRLNSIRLLGLDPTNILGSYLDRLNEYELWKEVSGQVSDMEFIEYMEQL